MTGQGLQIHDFVLYSASKGQMDAGSLVLKLGPEDAWGIQKLQPGIHTYPLFAPGDARPVARLGGLPLGHLVDEGGLSHVGDPHHHGPHGAAHQPLGLPLLQLLLQRLPDDGGELANSLAVSGVGLQHRPALSAEPVSPYPVHGRIGLIRPVEYDQAGFLPHQFVNIRVTAGDRDAGVYDLRHQIHQFEIRLDLPPGFGHMARILLNIHAFTLSTEYSCIIHNAPVFEKGKDA